MATNELVLHKGGRLVSYDDLDGMPMPEATPSHIPIPHKTVVDTATRQFAELGFKIDRQQHSVADGAQGMLAARYFGIIDLDTSISDGVGLSVGLRNAHDKSMKAGGCAGERVFVCDNLAFSSEIVVLRMHTRHILRDLEQRMAEGFASLPQFVKHRERFIERLRDWNITTEFAHDLAVRAIDANVISTRELKPLLTEFRRDDNAERFGSADSLWSHYNAFTELKKKRFDDGATKANAAAKDTIALNRLFVEQYPALVN